MAKIEKSSQKERDELHKAMVKLSEAELLVKTDLAPKNNYENKEQFQINLNLDLGVQKEMNLKRNDITVDLLKTELEQADLMRQYEAEIE